jgi:hypothetical protein
MTFDPRTFFRIHRAIILNLERVRGLELQESGEYEVVLDSKIRVDVDIWPLRTHVDNVDFCQTRCCRAIASESMCSGLSMRNCMLSFKSHTNA